MDGSYEPSHLDLRCLTVSLSTLRINFFSSDSLLKKKKKKKTADDKCRLKLALKKLMFAFIELYDIS